MGKERVRELRVPTRHQVERLLRSFSRAPTSIRNRALVAVLWRCGLRVSEALALRPGDLDHTTGRLVVRRGKGGRSRVVGIDPGALAMVDAWTAVRPPRATTLFCTLAGRPMSSAYVRAMLLRKGRRLDLPGLHPHAFRHAYATELAREGTPVPYIQRLLGHASLATTATYLEGLGADEAVEFVRAREWALG